jgi:hypothetical protein
MLILLPSYATRHSSCVDPIWGIKRYDGSEAMRGREWLAKAGVAAPSLHILKY